MEKGKGKMGKHKPLTEQRRRADKAKLPAIHPGEILLEDYLKPLGLSVNRLALRVPVTRMAEIVHGRRSITPDTVLRLGALLQYQRTVLAECPERLRFGSCRR